MDMIDKVALSAVIAGKLKALLDECKNEINTKLQDIFDNNTPDIAEINTKYYTKNSKYPDGIYKILHNDKSAGLFIVQDNIFLPVSKRRTETPIDKEEYENQKKSFLLANADSIKITANQINTLRKKIDGSIEGKALNQILTILENEDEFVKTDTSYRLNTKKASALANLAGLEDIQNIIEKVASKPIMRPGTSLLEMFGYSDTTNAETRITQSQKDKILDLLLDRDTQNFRDKDSLQKKVNDLNTHEKGNLFVAINAVYTDIDAFVKINDDFKDGTYYSNSKSYTASIKDLAGSLKIKPAQIKDIIEKFGINIDTDKTFQYEGEKDIKNSYFIKNISFDDLKSKNFNEYIIKEAELAEIQRGISVNFSEKEKQRFAKSMKLKPY